MSKRRSLGPLFDRADDLLSKHDGKTAYNELKRAYDAHEENKKNVELLWRLARACHVVGSQLAVKDAKRKEIFEEGHRYGTAAEQLDSQHFNALKYAAVLSGDLAEHLPTRERIKAGFTIKGYLDKALKVQPNDEMLRHMRGRFCYAVASLT
ncbi:CRE-RMD-2 protein, partial [Aphelenchoides avenae]